MPNVEEKLAKSLTADSVDLIPYLPYLLQDLWELGSSPKDIIDLIVKHIPVSEKTRVLDLACGKGAVSIQVAKAFGCKVKGIDIIPEFIDFADKKAREYGVENLCEFKIGDINEAVMVEKSYDIVIFGGAGDVLGNPEETIQKLISTIKKGGYIFIDDAYGNDNTDGSYPAREKWLLFFNNTGVKILDERFKKADEIASINDEQQSFIVKRANELKAKYPEKAYLFDSYVKSQQAECDELMNELSVVTMLITAV